MNKVFILPFFIYLFFSACCGPRSNESIPLISNNFRGYIGKATDEFLINCWYSNQLLGKIYGSPDSVIVSETGVFIPEGRMISLFSESITSFDADIFLRVPDGDGVRFYFRAAGKDFEKSPKLKFEFTIRGCNLYENNKLLVSVDSIRLFQNTQYRVFLQNEGSLVNVIVGIDTVWQGRTQLPLTEFVNIEPINGSVYIEDVYFYKLVP